MLWEKSTATTQSCRSHLLREERLTTFLISREHSQKIWDLCRQDQVELNGLVMGCLLSLQKRRNLRSDLALTSSLILELRRLDPARSWLQCLRKTNLQGQFKKLCLDPKLRPNPKRRTTTFKIPTSASRMRQEETFKALVA